MLSSMAVKSWFHRSCTWLSAAPNELRLHMCHFPIIELWFRVISEPPKDFLCGRLDRCWIPFKTGPADHSQLKKMPPDRQLLRFPT
jgi:hypothetical protein